MSFGWSGSDVFLLAQLAWNTVQNSRKACGEYDDLTRETLRLHAVLQRLAQEVDKQESPINRPGETSKEQLERIAIDCEGVLQKLDKIVAAYASLSEEKRSVRKIWQRVRFGNGQMADLADLRSKLISYTSEMLLYLNLVSMSTVGRIEQRMIRDEGVLRDIKIAVEKKIAHTALGGNQEGSIWTSHTADDTGFWRSLRRDLIKDGLPSAAIHKHKHLIKKYVKELGARGILDDPPSIESDQPEQDIHTDSGILEDVKELPGNRSADLNSPWAHLGNIAVQPAEDEQSSSDSTESNLVGDIDASFSEASDAGKKHGLSSRSRSLSVDISRNRNSDHSFPTRSEAHQPSSGVKHPLLSRSETMTVDRMRPCHHIPLKSSNLKNMKAPSETSDSSSESDSEMTEEDYPPPRPTPLQRRTTYQMSWEGAYILEPETYTTHRKESRQTSERPPIDSREAPTRVPPVARAMSSTYQPDERRPGLSRHESVPITPSKSRDSDRSDKLFAEYEYDGTMRKSFGDPPEPSKAPEEDNAPYKSGGVWICPDAGSTQQEAVSNGQPQGSAPKDKIRNMIQRFHVESLPQCVSFLNEPPPDSKEKRKLYGNLTESILQIVLGIGEVSVEDELLKAIKERLIINAQSALEQLDRAAAKSNLFDYKS